MKSLLECVRTLLILGRVSNLPTVWSNLIVGWILVAFEPIRPPLALSLPLVGGSLLYIGGMYLNDFCDAKFDKEYNPWRPIPAGKISRSMVGILAVLWFLAGLECLIPFGPGMVEIGLILLAAIVLYDFHHKNVAWAPLVMGACRFMLYLLMASVYGTMPGYILYLGAILGLYVAGITYVARGESRPDKPVRWALLLLLLPIVCPFLNCALVYRMSGDWPSLSASFLYLAWLGWLLIPLWRKTNRSISRVVSGLLAGIVLVDMIAVAPILDFDAAWFLMFFALALLLQRVIPAT
jgi:hypothetical protein